MVAQLTPVFYMVLGKKEAKVQHVDRLKAYGHVTIPAWAKRARREVLSKASAEPVVLEPASADLGTHSLDSTGDRSVPSQAGVSKDANGLDGLNPQAESHDPVPSPRDMSRSPWSPRLLVKRGRAPWWRHNLAWLTVTHYGQKVWKPSCF